MIIFPNNGTGSRSVSEIGGNANMGRMGAMGAMEAMEAMGTPGTAGLSAVGVQASIRSSTDNIYGYDPDRNNADRGFCTSGVPSRRRMRECMARIIENPDRFVKMSQASRQTFPDQFEFSKASGVIRRVLDEVKGYL